MRFCLSIFSLLVVIIPILISLITFHFLFPSNPTNQLSVFIAILSARNNSAQRNAIRTTWKEKNIDAFIGVNVKSFFIVGNKDCFVHPLLRKDPFSCDMTTIDADAHSDN